MHGYASEWRRYPIHGLYVEKCGKWQNQFTEKLFKKNGFLGSLQAILENLCWNQLNYFLVNRCLEEAVIIWCIP
jgi:hypothetical protein